MAHCKTSGGWVSGKIKLGITLRLLAGGDSYDLGVLFDISPKHCHVIMHEVLKNWIIDTNIGDINITKYLNDDERMNRVSEGFSKRSNGIFKGAIGALDGWLVRINRPSFSRDNIKNVSGFFSRKGFYALNIQCIVDDRKRVLWLSYRHKGGLHDSSCFRDTKLYQYLQNNKKELYEKGFFILGDSAYCIESFLIPPYDNAKPKSAEDDFNFYHSSARITVECTFGEIDLCWGIFWKRLFCSLENAALIIEGAARLHNFLVDYRERYDCHEELTHERVIFHEDILNTNAMPVQTGSDLGRPRGRILDEERSSRIEGMVIRDNLKKVLREGEMYRPRKNEWYCDFASHTYRK